MPHYDWIIQGGHVIDPKQGIDQLMDLAILKGRIAAVEMAIEKGQARECFDAQGMIVTPGLIDLHIHGYPHVTPLGIDVDHYCLGRGVTTAVDAGSAGCDTFPGFRHFAVQPIRTRLLAFLHISRAGLAFSTRTGNDDPGELESKKLVNASDCVECIEANRDLIVGVKIRLSSSIADQGRNEAFSYQAAQEAAADVSLPLMVHHNFSSVSMEDCPGKMKEGDLYTHCFHGYPNTILKPQDLRLLACVAQARRDGVLFDVGHGMGSFAWPVAEACIAQGFWPDTISTDLHSLNHEGPVYDLPTVMSRLWQAGMPLQEVIRASTLNPARAIGWADRIGTLEIGREADITVLERNRDPLELEDCHAQLRTLPQRLVPAAVWRNGEPFPITHPKRLPNPECYPSALEWRSKLVVSDPPSGSPPPPRPSGT